MSTTIFCTFEQQDMADLAMGDLRAATKGIKSIHYIADYKSNAASNAATGAGFWGMDNYTGTPPSRPVTVKIVCSDSSVKTVTARLVNLHAYQIITTN